MKLKDLIIQFLEYLEIERNKSQKTLENYNHYLKRFLEFSKIIDSEKIDLEIVRKYRLFLNRFTDKQGNNLKKSTQNYHIIALRAFLKYLVKNDIKTLSPEKIELAKAPERELVFLEKEEVLRLLSAPKDKDILSLRDKATLETLFSTGLRVSELCSLDNDIDLKKDEMPIRGKGEKIRVVFISQEAKEAIQKYLSKRKDMNDAFSLVLVKAKIQKD